jgi:hypothetical protein
MNHSSQLAGLFVAGIFLFFQLGFSTSCKKEALLPVDPNYPTTYFPLNTDSLLQLRVQYHSRYPYVYTGIDEFGFFGYDTFPESFPLNLQTSYSEEKIKSIAATFLADNSGPSGITDTSYLFSSVEKLSDTNGDDHWYVKISQQWLDTIEVLGTGLGLRIINGEIISSGGKWYPEIYIPPVFNFNSEKAKTQLVNHNINYYDMVGGKSYKLSSEDIQKVRSIRLKILPINESTSIRMYIVWEIKTGIFFAMVDVMTGQVVSDGTTVIFK